MNRLSRLLKALLLITRQPSLLNKVLDDANVNKAEVIKKYNLPLGLKTIDITQLLPGFDQTITPFSALDGGSTPIDLGLLKGLAAAKQGCDYFEIGTWRGESVANVAAVASSCVTLNLSDSDLLKAGADERYVNMHRFFSKDLENVTHIQGNSQTFDYKSLNKKFDLLFIDGDHHYQSVKNDTANMFRLLKDENSIIVWHDYGNNPTDIRWDVLRGILDGIPVEKHKFLYRVSNTLCAIYTTQPVTAKHSLPFISPEHYFSIHVQSHPL